MIEKNITFLKLLKSIWTLKK